MQRVYISEHITKIGDLLTVYSATYLYKSPLKHKAYLAHLRLK